MATKILKHFLVIILAIVLTTVLTWPFALNLRNYYADSGDYVGIGSTLWWSYESLLNGRILNSQQYFNGFQLYPMPYTLAFNDHFIFPSFIFGLFFILTNNFVFSVNLLSFTALVLSFISCFYVLNYFLKNSYASLVGAVIFTFNPITFAQFPQHAYLFFRFLLPPLFLFAYRFFKMTKPKDAFFLGLLFTLNALTVIYYQIYSMFLLMVLAATYIFINLFNKNFSYVFMLIKNGLVILVFIPLLLYFNLPYLEFNNLEGAKRSIEQNIYYSARVADWFSPPRSSLLYKDFSYALNSKRFDLEKQDNYYHEEHNLFLNFIPMFLFAVSIKHFLKKRKQFLKLYLTSPLPFFFTILLITLLMTFGPVFTGWDGTRGDFKLPFYYFYEYLPFGKGVRVPTRFQFIFYLPFALFCAYGALFLFNKIKRYFFAVFMIIMVLLVIENINIFSFDTTSYILPKVEKLSQNSELSFLRDKNVLHLPIIFPDFVQTEGVYHNWRIVTGEKIVNMHSGYNPQDQINLLLKLKEGVGLNELKNLAALNVHYVILHKDLIDVGQYNSRFKDSEGFFQKGTIFNKEDTQIIDLSKFDFDIKKCDFNNDFDKDVKQAAVLNTNIQTNVLVLKNKSDCFLPSIYNDRYKSMNLYINFIKYTANFRLPILIEPYQEVILSELNNELKIQ